MRLPTVFGIILIILGVLTLAVGSQTLNSPLSPLFGIIALVGGIILVIFGSRAKPTHPK